MDRRLGRPGCWLDADRLAAAPPWMPTDGPARCVPFPHRAAPSAAGWCATLLLWSRRLCSCA